MYGGGDIPPRGGLGDWQMNRVHMGGGADYYERFFLEVVRLEGKTAINSCMAAET